MAVSSCQLVEQPPHLRGLGHSSDELVAVQAMRAPGTDTPEDRTHPQCSSCSLGPSTF